MSHASKVIPGYAQQWLPAKGKKQLYWVLIVTAGLLLAARGGRMVGSFMRGAEQATDGPAALAEFEGATDGGSAADAGAQALAADDSRRDEYQRDEAKVAAQTEAPANDQDASPAADATALRVAGDERRQRLEILIAESAGDNQCTAVDGAQANESTEPDNSRSTRVGKCVGREPEGKASRETVARVLAALGARNADHSAAPECRIQPSDVARALFSAQSGADSTLVVESAQPRAALQGVPAGRADVLTTAADEARESPAVNSSTQRLARLFGGRSQSAQSSTTADQAAPVNAVIASWQELFIGLSRESGEAVAETTIAVDSNGAGKPQAIGEAATDEPAKTEEYAAESNVTSSLADESVAGTDPRSAADREDASNRELPRAASAELVLVNPASGVDTIRYLVNGHSFSMPPGHSQHLPATRDWRVHFHRGGNLDDVEIVLRSGTYEFRASEAGWQLWATDVDAAN
jgi:hypothetical protein